MDNDHKKACFEYLRKNRTEVFEWPETWRPATRYYLSLLDEKYPQDVFFSWNWPGFFFFPYWALYRKMIAFGIISIFLLPIFWPLGHLIGGVLATPLYLYFVKRKVALGKTQKSATSWAYALIGLFCTASFVGFLFLLMGAFLLVASH